MIKLLNTPALQRAVTRAAQNHNHVSQVSVGTYSVRSGKSDTVYTVTFSKSRSGDTFADCNCRAGRDGHICHHVVAAGWFHKAMIRIRKVGAVAPAANVIQFRRAA